MGDFWSWFPAFGWVLIPVTAILVGGFKEWLKFRAKTERLDASSEEFVRAIAALRDDRDVLQRRVERLESVLLEGRAVPTTREASLEPAAPGERAAPHAAVGTRALPEAPDLLDVDDLFADDEPEHAPDQTRLRPRPGS